MQDPILLAAACLLGLALVVGILTHGPRLLVCALALVAMIAVHAMANRAAYRVYDLRQRTTAAADRDHWARPTRAQRRVIARSQRLALLRTEMTALFPQVSERGAGLAARLRLA